MESSPPLNTEPPTCLSVQGGGGGATTTEGVVGDAAGGSVGGRSGAKGEAGGELFKVDLDPTGMYAAACSFDKVRARRRSSQAWCACYWAQFRFRLIDAGTLYQWRMSPRQMMADSSIAVGVLSFLFLVDC